LRRVASWLRPNSYLLATFAASDNPGWRGEWLGTEMFFSGWEPAKTLELVRTAELEVVQEELETIHEPQGDATFLWVLAQKPREAGRTFDGPRS
jgi:hypothetical protein